MAHVKPRPESLPERLGTTSAVMSLQNEQRVVSVLQRLGWRVQHGPFYRDPTTGKIREIDVVARRFWRRRTRGHDQSVSIEVLCEIKSVRDYHLIFAPHTAPQNIDTDHKEWVGFHEKRLAATLAATGLSSDDVAVVLGLFKDACYTAGGLFRIRQLLFEPPKPRFQTSAFRETNIGSDKELEASVLWRAMQTAMSALESSRSRYLDARFDDLQGDVEFAGHVKGDLAEIMKHELEYPAGHVELYHPIVIVESHLWASQNGQVVELPSCRFYQVGPDWSEMWCDIVTMKEAPSFLRALTKYYSAQARQHRLRR